MEITKNNKCVCGVDTINFHDFNISSMNYNIEKNELKFYVSYEYKDESKKKYLIRFLNVFDTCFTHRESDGSGYFKIILDWGEIPNDYCHDNYIETVKRTYISNGSKWNDELFAVRFMFLDISYLYVICEKIVIDEC